MRAPDRSIITDQVASGDGTPIVFDRFGDGRPLIVVGGQLCDRTRTRPLAERLGEHFGVINYDRRGKGDSGDTAPYAIEREIEDLAALVAAAGGTAAVYGHSSGAALVLHAAAHGLPLTGLVLHEPPYGADDSEERRVAREYAARLEVVLSEDRHGDAIELCLRTVGMAPEMIEEMRDGPGPRRRCQPGVDDRHRPAGRRHAAQRTPPRPRGPGARRHPGATRPVLAQFVAG